MTRFFSLMFFSCLCFLVSFTAAASRPDEGLMAFDEMADGLFVEINSPRYDTLNDLEDINSQEFGLFKVVHAEKDANLQKGYSFFHVLITNTNDYDVKIASRIGEYDSPGLPVVPVIGTDDFICKTKATKGTSKFELDPYKKYIKNLDAKNSELFQQYFLMSSETGRVESRMHYFENCFIEIPSKRTILVKFYLKESVTSDFPALLDAGISPKEWCPPKDYCPDLEKLFAENTDSVFMNECDKTINEEGTIKFVANKVTNFQVRLLGNFHLLVKSFKNTGIDEQSTSYTFNTLYGMTRKISI